jgi:hypothetical protein
MVSLRIQLQIDDFFTELPMTSLMKHGPFPQNRRKQQMNRCQIGEFTFAEQVIILLPIYILTALLFTTEVNHPA